MGKDGGGKTHEKVYNQYQRSFSSLMENRGKKTTYELNQTKFPQVKAMLLTSAWIAMVEKA